LERRQRFATALTDGSASLDRLNTQCRIRGAKEVFIERCRQSTAQAQTFSTLQLQRVMGRFVTHAVRAARRSSTLPKTEPM
jgi:hypothetical protein